MKKERILKGAYTKPQNQFSTIVRNKVKKEIAEWLKQFDLHEFQENLLADELFDRAIAQRIKDTDATAPHCYLSDGDKVDSLVMAIKKIAIELEEELETLLSELEDRQETDK